MNFAKIAARVASAGQARVFVVDSNNRVCYPFSSVQAADGLVRQLLAGLDPDTQRYLSEDLGLGDLSAATAQQLMDAEAEVVVVQQLQEGALGVSERFDTAARASFLAPWPDDDPGAFGEPISDYPTAGKPDGAAVPAQPSED